MLTNISIKNYKTLKNTEIQLAPLTLLSGLNGLGKSSVIQILLLLRQSFKNSNFENGLFLRGDLIELGLGKDVYSIDSDVEEGIYFDVEWNYETNLGVKFDASLDKDVLSLNMININDNLKLDEKALFSKRFQYLCANRINPQIQYKTSSYFVEELNSLGKTGEYTAHYLAKFQDKVINNINLKHPKAKSDTLIDNVSAWMAELSPGVKINATYHKDLESASISYQFEERDEYTDSFKPIHVGFGLTYVLPVITALLMSQKGDLLIIENPESHLHPAGQSRIGHLCALVAQEGVQLILESHSDHVLNGIRVAVKQQIINSEDTALYFFQRDINSNTHETDVIPLFIDENGRIDEWPKGFMDEWEKQLNILLEK
ncbi:MAG: DUF3696 domain-containing protein [Marinifilaceae bacterium]|jgi:predicted ATPase|nr:DUF3696 domain-containing protein [Marinifilaceae bacterium]